MRFINKYTKQVIEANDFVELFAFSHNSNYEKINSNMDSSELKKTKNKNIKKTDFSKNKEVSNDETDKVKDIDIDIE